MSLGSPNGKNPWTKTKTTNRIFCGNLKVTYGNTVRFGAPGLAIIFVGEEMVEAKDLFLKKMYLL